MIEKIKKISIEKLVFISIMTILIGLTAILLFRYTCLSLNYNILPKMNREYLLWYVVPVLFVLYILDLFFNKKKISYIDIFVYLLIIFGALSTIFAVDMKISIYGANTRNEGLLSLLSYYFILLNLKNMTNEKYKKIIIKTIIILGVIQMIYSILQVYTNWSFILHYPTPFIAFGLCGNPNFLGSYMVILACFTFSMYMLERQKRYLVLTLLFFIGICLCSSTGPLLSFVLVIIFFAIYYKKRLKWKDCLKVLLLLISTYFLVGISVGFVHNKVFNREVKTDYNISSVRNDLKLSNFGNGRVNLWKNSLPLVKKYWAVGTGLDNFGKVYGVRNGRYYDKAHNVYLQIAITNGIPALIIYMVIIGFIFFKGLKIEDKFYISLLMAFIGYCIQAFANISVIEVAPTFYVICGLLLGKIQNKKKENNNMFNLPEHYNKSDIN